MSDVHAILVTGLDVHTTEKDIDSTFSFCGRILRVLISWDTDASKKAVVIFDKANAVETALLLSMGFIKEKQITVNTYQPNEDELLGIDFHEGDLKPSVPEKDKIMDWQMPINGPKPFHQERFVFVYDICPTVSAYDFIKYFSFCGNIESYWIDRETQTALLEFSKDSSREIALACSGIRLGQQILSIDPYNPSVHGINLYSKLYDADPMEIQVASSMDLVEVKSEEKVAQPPLNESIEINMKERVICVPLSRIQRHYYKDLVTDLLEEDYTFTEIIQRLCKCCNHPFTIPQDSFISEISKEKILEAIIHWSGKYKYLDSFISELKEKGQNILICSSDMRNIEVLNHLAAARNYSICNFFEPTVNNATIYWLNDASNQGLKNAYPHVDNVLCCDPYWNVFNNSVVIHLVFSQNKPIQFHRIITRYTIEECLYKTLFSFSDTENTIEVLDAQSLDMSLRYGVYHFFFNENFDKDDAVVEDELSFSKSDEYQPHDLPSGPIDIRSETFWTDLKRRILQNSPEEISKPLPQVPEKTSYETPQVQPPPQEILQHQPQDYYADPNQKVYSKFNPYNSPPKQQHQKEYHQPQKEYHQQHQKGYHQPQKDHYAQQPSKYNPKPYLPPKTYGYQQPVSHHPHKPHQPYVQRPLRRSGPQFDRFLQDITEDKKPRKKEDEFVSEYVVKTERIDPKDL